MSVVALIDYTKSRGIAFVPDFIGTLITWEKIFPIKDVPLETDDLVDWLYRRFIEKEDLLSHFYETGAFPPHKGHEEAVAREMTLSNMWIFLIQSFAFLSGYLWYNVMRYFYHCLF